MENNTNLLEILKDCPKGTKLYSPMIGECELKCINNFIVVNSILMKLEYKFFTDGTYTKGSECMLFPSKECRNWDNFKRPFVEGDVIVSRAGNIAIYSHFEINSYGKNLVYYQCLLYSNDEIKVVNDYGIGYIEDCRYATKEEKERLYKALKKEGYRYNPTTKNVERIKKFDISTLKPFDKVLVRDTSNNAWYADLYSHFSKGTHLDQHITIGGSWNMCIPYEGNEYLVGTTNEPNDFFITWE